MFANFGPCHHTVLAQVDGHGTLEQTRNVAAMIDDEYLERGLSKFVEDGVRAAQVAVLKVESDENAKGTLRSSRAYIGYQEAVSGVFAQTFRSMSAFAFNYSGGSASSVQALDRAGDAFVAAATGVLAQKYDRGKAYVNMAPSLSEVTEALTKAKDRTVDDYKHGMIGEARLKRDPIVSVMNNMNNSPGAVQQTAVGDDNRQSVQQNANALLSAIDSLLSSDDFKSLESENKLAVTDLADTLRDEIRKPTPDAPKVRRWVERLGSLAAQAGMNVASAIFIAAATQYLGLTPPPQ
jgi:hypothetical protein